MSTPVGEQLELRFLELPWNGVSPRYLTKHVFNRTFAKAARLERDIDAGVMDPHQLQLPLEGAPYGS